MASEEHLKLSHKIKELHKHLRIESKQNGPEIAWSNHLNQKIELQEYAEAMHELATKHWSQNRGVIDRINWSVQFILSYFQPDQLEHYRERERKIIQKLASNEKVEVIGETIPNDKIQLLDVGSCYNPFKIFEKFNVTAIDIVPAKDTDVFDCDFLTVPITYCETRYTADNNRITSLSESSFDVVVFSLLLEYIPSSEQRIMCCQRAYRILRTEGILIIITPDSKHIGANAKLMKTWRYTLALLGLQRIKFEKLRHITCMSFRKSISMDIPIRWATINREPYMLDKLEIPQDHLQNEVHERDQYRTIHFRSDKETIDMFLELPNMI